MWPPKRLFPNISSISISSSLPSHCLSHLLPQDQSLPVLTFGSEMSRCHTPPVLLSSLCHPIQSATLSAGTLSPPSSTSLAPSTLCHPVLHHLHLVLLQNTFPQDVRHPTLKLTEDTSHPRSYPDLENSKTRLFF